MTPAAPHTFTLAPIDPVVRFAAPSAGCLVVQAGPVWVTRDHDLTDHVRAAGEGLALQAGDRLTAQAWQAGVPVALRFQPRSAAADGGWADRWRRVWRRPG